jgi:hypothetical protein
MKKLICPMCKKSFSDGKFCLDCGQKLTEVITSDIGFRRKTTSRSPQTLKIDIRKWLNRIGVQNPDIQIFADAVQAKINYIIKGKKYSFSSDKQRTEADNLATIEQFIHYRVLGIEWGIESEEKAFAGYEALPDFTGGKEITDPYLILGFQKPVDIDVARSKFKSMVKQFHPDINSSPEAANQFRRIKAAMDKIEVGHALN